MNIIPGGNDQTRERAYQNETDYLGREDKTFFECLTLY